MVNKFAILLQKQDFLLLRMGLLFPTAFELFMFGMAGERYDGTALREICSTFAFELFHGE